MTRGRLLIAGLTAAAAMTAADASAQNCPEWLTIACPGESLNVAAEEGGPQGQGEQRRAKATTGPRNKQGRPAAADTTTNPQPQQMQAPEPARQARTARPAMNDREKEALFQQFLTWREERRQNAETNRGR